MPKTNAMVRPAVGAGLTAGLCCGLIWLALHTTGHLHQREEVAAAAESDDARRAVVPLQPFLASVEGKTVNMTLSAVVLAEDDTAARRAPRDRQLHAQLRDVVTDTISGPRAADLLRPKQRAGLLRRVLRRARSRVADYHIEEILMTDFLILG